MNIIKLSHRNMTYRPLSTAPSLISLTSGAGLVSLRLHVDHHIRQQI